MQTCNPNPSALESPASSHSTVRSRRPRRRDSRLRASRCASSLVKAPSPSASPPSLGVRPCSMSGAPGRAITGRHDPCASSLSLDTSICKKDVAVLRLHFLILLVDSRHAETSLVLHLLFYPETSTCVFVRFFFCDLFATMICKVNNHYSCCKMRT